MLLLADDLLDDRRRAARGPLAPLYNSLASELEPLVGRDLFVPREKALLSRAGGRCEKDGTTLEFDPWSPQSHHCPRCGTVHTGSLHHRSWITWYQLWLAERAVHASLFHLLTREARYAVLARDILTAYADAYLTYPNRDNVLGPTRPFFSTYLESIWLLQICVAANLLEHSGDTATADVVRDRIVEPSSALIAQFDEGNSNRQVWNNVALLASALLQRDHARAEAVVTAKSGIANHLTQALLPDGTWFEGDNYHQFAIRGLWYAVTMCEANAVPLVREASDAFHRGIAATFVTALPDFTLPSRKDSQYAVSLRQWRFAELAELGLARGRSAELGGVLARCYEPGHERRDTGRARSTADAERNGSSSSLTRTDLGWRSLLHALPELPELRRAEPRSVNLTGQGLAIFRRRADVYVALDYGQTGAGHGHPDRLNLLLSDGATRWLDDLGTGSYVDQSLHWYRSTLSHNAPLVDGHSQRFGNGSLNAYDEQGDFGWIEGRFTHGDVELVRTVVVTPHYLVDELSWSALSGAQIDVPWHLNATLEGVVLAPATVDGGSGLEDGFEFAREWASCVVPAAEPVRMHAEAGGRTLRVSLLAESAATLIRGVGPGQPATEKRAFYMVRLRGERGRLRAVVAWDPAAGLPEFDREYSKIPVGTAQHTHCRSPEGWRIDLQLDGVTKTVELGGRLQQSPVTAVPHAAVERTKLRRGVVSRGWWSEMQPVFRDRTVIAELNEVNYRRSEESWRDAGAPTATVAVAAAESTLEVFIQVHAKNQRFTHASATNRLDNEHPDTMGAGVQLYVAALKGRGMWMLIPEPGSDRVRVREIPGLAPMEPPVARWRALSDGYEMRIELPIPLANPVDLDVVINEAVEGGERRRGQLVTADVRGEFVYLRGDRESGLRPIRLDVTA